MRRVILFGLFGLLALGLAGADLAARAASWLVPNVEVVALDSQDHPEEPVVTEVDGTEVEVDVPEATLERQDVLLVGTDTREGMTDAERRAIGANDDSHGLTDTIIWLQYLPDSNDVRMVSFPRDLQVHDERFGTEKINALHTLYGDEGPTRLVEEVESLVGADLDHYVEIRLAGFVDLTDAIGGVEICLQEGFTDSKVGTFEPGCQEVDGIDAGRFIRARHVSDEFGGGAYGRNRRQQYFVKQALEQTLSAGKLSNPVTLQRLVSVASDVAVVDDGLSLTEMYDLARVFASAELNDIEGLNLPVTGGYACDGCAWYDYPLPEAELVYEALRAGTPLPPVDEDGNVVVDAVAADDGAGTTESSDEG